MSELEVPAVRRSRLRRCRRARRPDDRGFTLPEVLVSIVITGTLVGALASAASLIVRQAGNNQGRLSNSRSEESMGIWMPADLASAETVSTDPSASPCGNTCPPGVNITGSNALLLTWSGSVAGVTDAVPTTTTVSYRYEQNGTEFEIRRIECVSVGGAAPTCSQIVVLHDVPAPPGNVSWQPGVTAPSWVMTVRLATDPSDPTLNGDVPIDPTYKTKNGRRVSVTINGGGSVAGGGGGQDVVTLSAGGTDRVQSLPTNNFTDVPTFSATRSRCGGNFGMIVDTSGSIGSTNMTSVKSGITQFINTFAGTPIKLQIVRFSTNATTLGAGSGWSRYYDMLVDSDVADLKTQVGTLTSNGSTNYEDGLFRMFENSDGSVQSILPNTLIFFTDGVPNYTRQLSTTGSAPAVADPADASLPQPTSSGSAYNQVAFNRASRIARQFDPDVNRFIGVLVGADATGQSTWLTQGAGYHYSNYLRGFHQTWDSGYHIVNPQRGYHLTYQYATTGINYQVNSSNQYQYDALHYVPQQKSGSTWSNTTWTTYWTGVTGAQASKYQVVAGTGSGGWTATTKANFDARTNGNAAPAAAFRVVGSSAGSWSNINTSSTAAAIATARTYYLQYNTTAGGTDGFQIVNNGTPGGWTSTTVADFNLSDVAANDFLAADTNDGYQPLKSYTSPYSLWETTTEALYVTNNTTTDNTDGWSGTLSTTAPFDYWQSTTQALYIANNTTADSTDGWRVNNIYSAPYTNWEATDAATYAANNTTSDNTDGWDATKSYTLPYTLYEPYTSTVINNSDVLGRLVTAGTPVPAQPTGGPYTNAAVADLYALPNWSQFASAINGVALAECGGTVTLQTRVGSAAAADPFTYQNSVDLKTATTSSQYRSGTFDYALTGGVSVTATITPLYLSTLTKYNPGTWSCTSAGSPYPFTVVPIAGTSWTAIKMTVSPNNAVSCIQSVTLK